MRVIVFSLFFFWMFSQANGWGQPLSTSPTSHTWRVVSDLTAAERALFDPRTDTPRDPQYPNLPAERYPFTPPYTAEEMGYRAMEFSHSPRWSCNLIDVTGALTAEGFLRTSKMYSPIFYVPNASGHYGLTGELYGTAPGGPTRKITGQNIFPPEDLGNQMVLIQYRAGGETATRWDMYAYSPALRRVRRQPQPRRGDKLAQGAESFDDIFGRDPWEFSWRLVGVDTLAHSVRFPKTRPTVTLADANGTLSDIPTSRIKMMGDDYPFYTADGGVECWVVEAQVKEDWLPDYYAPRILYWLDKQYFYPLRIEQYSKDGNLIFVETRIAKHQNKAMADKGYGILFNHYWDVTLDYMRYSVHDAHEPRDWSVQDRDVFFSPGVLPRVWFFAPLKSQSEVLTAEQYFLRPSLDREKFPATRKITLSPEIESKLQAQEAAGHLVFED
ncbi:MAG: DUF1329 domain-containing protein [Deltaproteobacteria bacterium]|nr:DUF1329 domain-containing protein [Deltaproteobacteria bacterium]